MKTDYEEKSLLEREKRIDYTTKVSSLLIGPMLLVDNFCSVRGHLYATGKSTPLGKDALWWQPDNNC